MSALLITFVIVGCLYIEDLPEQCTTTTFPTISMIAGKEYFDRAFIFTMVVYAFVVGQINVRAYYTRLDGLIEKSTNTFLFYLGMLMLVFPPCISILDMYTFPTAHNFVAIPFFVLAFIYIFWLTTEFSVHKEDFGIPE